MVTVKRILDRQKLASITLLEAHRHSQQPCVSPRAVELPTILGGKGEFRTEPFPLRVYEQYLRQYRPCTELREEEKAAIENELKSDLPDGYLGQVRYPRVGGLFYEDISVWDIRGRCGRSEISKSRVVGVSLGLKRWGQFEMAAGVHRELEWNNGGRADELEQG